MNLAVATLLVHMTLAARPQSGCGTLWLPREGKGDDTCLVITETRPLADYLHQIPYWDPCAYDGGRCTGPRPTDSLIWRPTETGALPRVNRAGALNGQAVYQVTYDPAYRVFVWDTGDGSFRPVLIISGDESIIAKVYPPEAFRWQGTDLIHVRVQITGTGNLQESFFLQWQGKKVVALPEDQEPTIAALKARGLQFFHRGGGFCRGTLTYTAGVAEPDGGQVGYFEGEYRLDSDAVRLEKLRLVLLDDPEPDPTSAKPCEVYP